jgi:hypothetical protein
LNGIRRIGRTTALERGAVESNGMIPTRKNEIANETFISIDNEVSSKFFGFFVVLHEFRRRQGTKITTSRLYFSIKIRQEDIG